MKLRHAAALALTGWYLMYPPISDCLGATQDHPCSNSPPSRWMTERVFDTADACQKALDDFTRQGMAQFKHATENKKPGTPPGFGVEETMGLSHLAAQCVATDDPRLKGN